MREDVELLVPLTFMIILGTVTLNGLSAKFVARILGLIQDVKNGVVIVGANEGSICIAKYLEKHNISNTLVDLSKENIRQAKAANLNVIEKNILSDDDDLEFNDEGHLLALTSSNDVNIFACRKLKSIFGESNVYRLITVNEIKLNALSKPQNILFSNDFDYIELIELVRKYPQVEDIKITSSDHFESLIKSNKDSYLPIMLRRNDSVQFITMDFKYQHLDGDVLAYIGHIK